jgi:hypothetical protein
MHALGARFISAVPKWKDISTAATEHFITFVSDTSLVNSKDMFTTGDFARKEADPGPSFGERWKDRAINSSASHVLGSLTLGGGAGFLFSLAAGGVTGVVGGALVTVATYGFTTAVTAARDFDHRRQTTYERPSSCALG